METGTSALSSANKNGSCTYEESLALKSLFGDNTSDDSVIKNFFRDIYQKKVTEFRWEKRHVLLSDSAKQKPEQPGWNEATVRQSPYEEVIHQGWEVLVQLLKEAGTGKLGENETTAPLIFKDMSSVSDQFSALYNNNAFAAYLDGCSVVFNHADWSSPWIASLCLDLQKSFPHTYANTYLTPPNCQAVNAHADDRDVIVIQVVGSKKWKIYQKIPIPYCYPHEQVGKEGLEVPAEVLNGPVLHETTLKPGDALYLPRGYVHEARATENTLSFHVTVALATHDWSLAGIISKATDRILHSVFPFRMALNRHIGIRELNEIPEEEKVQLQKQIDEAFRLVEEEVNIESVAENQKLKFQNHNERALKQRMKIIQKVKCASQQATTGGQVVVGVGAAENIGLDTTIRAASNDERALVIMDQQRGLHVREQCADAIIHILQILKSQPTLQCKIKDLRTLLADSSAPNFDNLCELTLLSFAKICVEQGALAVVQ